MKGRVFREYSRAEFLSDAVVHAIGIAAALAAIPVLIVLASLIEPSSAKITGCVIYGISMLAMLACSAAYNIIPNPDWTWFLSRMDHSAIYLKIAGTYTPFALVSGQGMLVLAAVWGAAVTGVSLKMVDPYRFRVLSLLLYLGMGWIGVLAGWAIFAALPAPVATLALIGGLLYTFGVVFHLWERLPFHNTIWHVFVLTATLVFYAAVTVAVVT